jgi:hypothetical protein
VSREAPSGGGGLSLQTLLISSLAAVAAAVVVPTFWERGSLVATAVTPIVVAIVSELLRKPTQVVTAVAPKVVRRTGTGTAVHTKETAAVGGRRRDVGAEQVAPVPPVPPVPPGGVSEEDPFGLRAAERPRRRFPLRLAVITGLIAAVIGAGVVTASELTVFSHSVGSSHHRTSLFGGGTKKSKDSSTEGNSSSSKEKEGSQATATPTPTPTATATATATPSATATATATPSPSATPAPAPATGATASPTPTP